MTTTKPPNDALNRWSSPGAAGRAWLRATRAEVEPAPVDRAPGRGPRAGRARVLHHAAALGLLAAMAFLLSSSMRSESPITDEAVHLTRGLAYFWGDSAALSYAHPPLGNALAALPIVLREPRRDMTQLDGFDVARVDRVARALLSEDYAERRRWFFDARAAVSLMALAMAAYCYYLASTLFGATAGLVGLFFVALHPTLIAHGRLMTTDLPVTAAMMVCLGELLLFLVGRSRWHALAAAGMFGAAITIKYTALALLPILGSMTLGCAWLGLGRYAGRPRARALGSVLKLALLVVVTGALSINVVYRFEQTGLRIDQVLKLPEPVNHITRSFDGRLLERRSVLKYLPGAARLPLPYTYVYGVASISVHDRKGHASAFFGKPQRDGHPLYFPVMLAIKTPLLQLVALAFAAAIFVRRRGRVSLAAGGLAFYCVVLVLLATRSSINIGIRHILPVLPALALLAGLGAARAFRFAGRSQLRASTATVLVAAHAFGLAWSYPDYISDFNALVGGRTGGERISIVGEEWGQDTARLGEALRARGVERLRFNYDTFTSVLELERFGVAVERLGCPRRMPEPGWIAVNARESARQPWCTRWTDALSPELVINNHVWVYRVGRNAATRAQPVRDPRRTDPT